MLIDAYKYSRYTKALDSIKNLRKERIADQKAEKIRLESLSKEKTRADELLKRINDIASKITAKEVLKEEAYKESIAVEASNTKFSDQARSFNEVFAKYEQLLTRREGLIKDIDELKPALEEVTGICFNKLFRSYFSRIFLQSMTKNSRPRSTISKKISLLERNRYAEKSRPCQTLKRQPNNFVYVNPN